MSALSGRRFLIAEDNALVRQMICELLFSHGAEAAAAQDGREAVRLFREDGPFDAVLMDISMPGMDGFAAARAIRRMDSRALIFAHTEAGAQYGEQEARDNGMDGAVEKPVSIGKLARRMAVMGDYARYK